MTARICRECKYHYIKQIESPVKKGEFGGIDYCSRSEMTKDLITGDYRGAECYRLRFPFDNTPSFFSCGVEGKYWEAIEKVGDV